jgi:hypothetical protein
MKSERSCLGKRLSLYYPANVSSQLEDVSEDFPEDFFKMKVLPELIKSVEFGGGGPKVFAVIMNISGKLSEDEYEQQLLPVIIRLFSSQDRAMRVCLLDNLPQMIDHIPQKIVSNNIFPQMVSGQYGWTVSNNTGHWIHRCGTSCSRTDCQINSHYHSKAYRSNRQRGAS